MRALREWGTGKLVAWDIRTGVVIKQLDVTLDSPPIQHQMMFAFAGRVHTFLRDGIRNTDALCKNQHLPRKGQLGPHWTHEGSLRFVTSVKTGEKLGISIREFRPIPTPSHPVLESFDVPYHLGQFSFSPIFFHASFLTLAEVIILDARGSNTLLRTGATEEDPFSPPGLFSPDGCFFGCRMRGGDISVWRNTPTGYTPWSTLQPRLPCNWFSFSPTATSILTWGPGGIQSLRPENHASPSTPKTTGHSSPRDKDLVRSSPDGTWIAIARCGGHIVTIVDPLSGTPQRSIDARTEIQDMKFIHNAIMVLGGRRIAEWNIATDGAEEVEVASRLPTHLGGAKLSDDGSQVAIFITGLSTCDVKSRQIKGWSEPGCKVEGFRFSPCGSRLWFWSTVNKFIAPYPHDTNRYFTQVEIEGGEVKSRTVDVVKDTWSLFAFLQSRDGFRIGHGGRWVEDSQGRKLFWLPPDWRVKDVEDMTWEGNFLALVDGRHEKPIIVQFQP